MDELAMITVNAALDSWVDSLPGAVSTGYQAQNTNIEAQRNGKDRSSVRWDSMAEEIILEVSGVIDENGLPFVCTTELNLAFPAPGVYYIALIAGSDTTHRSAELTLDPGTWDETKNGYYNISGFRVLDWEIEYGGAEPNIYRRLQTSEEKGLKIKDFKIGETIDKNVYDGIVLPDSGVTYWGFSSPNLANSARSLPIRAVGLDFKDSSSIFAAFANKGVLFFNKGYLIYNFTSSNEMTVAFIIYPQFVYTDTVFIIDTRAFAASNDNMHLLYYAAGKFTLLVYDDNSNGLKVESNAYTSNPQLQVRHSIIYNFSKGGNVANMWVNGIEMDGVTNGTKTTTGTGISNMNITKTLIALGAQTYLSTLEAESFDKSVFYMQSLLIANTSTTAYNSNYDNTDDEYYYEKDFIRGVNYNFLLDQYCNGAFNNLSVNKLYAVRGIYDSTKYASKAHFIYSTSLLFISELFPKISHIVPEIGDAAHVIGYADASGGIHIHRIERTTTTAIVLYGVSLAGSITSQTWIASSGTQSRLILTW